ncbi:hypothetical protein [Paracoccus sp. IB05]|uniref:hypothetical protein n=1 Tax=Paracoccus sp. IB05 TaxID=2779367 RepID=UPI0018E810E5|nr:hypothetical protein [Paracoccus sp. IB05]MBJ2152635.1 hypothetical protein [Paracoccus sp. IB05]
MEQMHGGAALQRATGLNRTRFKSHREGAAAPLFVAASVEGIDLAPLMQTDTPRNQYSAEFVMVAAIARPLLDWGVLAADAYRIGMKFAFSALGAEGHPPRFDPLYDLGETLLILTDPRPFRDDLTAPGVDGFAIVSDHYAPGLAAAAMQARGDEAEPVLIVNLSALCRRVAAVLGLDPATFLRPVAQVAA